MSNTMFETFEPRVLLSVSAAPIPRQPLSSPPAIHADLNSGPNAQNGPDGVDAQGGPSDTQPDSPSTGDGAAGDSSPDTDTLQSGSGQDVSAAGNALIARQNLAVKAQAGPDLAVTAVTGKYPASVLTGSSVKTRGRVTITNTGAQTAKGTIRIDLYASATANTTGNGPVLGTVTSRVDLKPGRSRAFTLPKFAFASGQTGKLFLVAKVTPLSGIVESNPANNVASTATTTTVAAGFIDLQNLFTGPVPASLVKGKRASLAVPVKNAGNIAARGIAAITVSAAHSATAPGATLATFNVPLTLKAGQTRRLRLRFTVPTLAAGNYVAVVKVTFPGDTITSNDVSASMGTFRIV